jgi:arylsulfatase A-like enzyme
MKPALILILAIVTPLSFAAEKKPNIILVMPDDAGMGDYSCFGSPIIKTPSVDAFKKSAMTFTHFHVSPTCSPTRSALMTGNHEFRNGVTHTIHERERLRPDAIALPQILKNAGYTTGIFGKWHLGDEAQYQPEKRGFDEVYIHGAGGIGQSYPGSCGDAPGNSNINPTLRHNGKFVKTEGYCTDLYFDQAARWIDSTRAADKPFFAYITPNAPHTPHVLPENYYTHHIDKVGEGVARFYGMIENIDANFGKLLAKLDEWKLAGNTIVIYMTSDNGGTAGTGVFDAGLRGGKVTAWEGGTRAPCMIRWPGVTKADAESDALTAHIDIFPTLAQVTGVAFKHRIDGRSLVPLMRNPGAEWPDRTLITHVGRWDVGKPPEKFGICAVRSSTHSLVRQKDKWALFDMRGDPGQKNDIAAAHPEIVKTMSASFDQWWNEVRPALVNEDAHKIAPKINTYRQRYIEQFGEIAPQSARPKGKRP